MKILALDLSTRRGAIALRENGGVVCAHNWSNDRRTSAPFFEKLDELIHANGAPDSIVVGLGPGSYTGSRIAISAAVGLQFATGAKVGGWPSIIAVSDELHFAVIGDAKRNSFFFANVEDGMICGEISLLSEVEMQTRLAAVDGPVYTSDDLPQFPVAILKFPSAELLGELAERFPEKQMPPPLAPIYLREPHITMPRAH